MTTINGILRLARDYRKDFKRSLLFSSRPRYCIPDSNYLSLRETRDIFIRQIPWYAPRRERIKAIQELFNLYGE